MWQIIGGMTVFINMTTTTESRQTKNTFVLPFHAGFLNTMSPKKKSLPFTRNTGMVGAKTLPTGLTTNSRRVYLPMSWRLWRGRIDKCYVSMKYFLDLRKLLFKFLPSKYSVRVSIV